MHFRQGKTIFRQIADRIAEQILTDQLQADQRLPSVRGLAIKLEVNLNTVVKSYALLEEQGLIYKLRGRGFFVREDARSELINHKRQTFIKQTLPDMFLQMQQLDLTIDDLVEQYQQIELSQKTHN